MADKIKGIEIAISADTTGVTKGLKEVNNETLTTSKNLKSVNSLLKLDPNNTELLAEKQKLLGNAIDGTKDKLNKMRAAQDDVKKAFERGDITEEQYIAFQGEIVKTEKQLRDLESQVDDTGDSMRDAGDQTSGFGDKLKNGLTVGAKAAAAAVAAVGKAVIAGTKKLADFTVAGVSYADTILTDSTVTGIATDKLQEYQYAAELVDVSTETLTKSMAKNIKSMTSAAKGTGDTAEAYKKLGVNVKNSDGSLRDSETVYWELIDALGNVENETERDSMAMQILGKSAQELNPLIEAGAGRMQELGQQAREAGAVMSDDMLNSYGAFDDQLQYLKVNAEAAKNALGAALLPALTSLATKGNSMITKFTKAANESGGDIGKMATALADMLPEAIDAMVAKLPQILELAKQIVSNLAKGLLQNLPTILSSATEMIMELANGLIANLPLILQCGLDIIMQLATGLAESLPKMIPTIVDIVLQIVETLIDNVDLLIDAAIAIILGLADGLIAALPTLIDKAPVIVEKLINAIINNAPELYTASFELVVKLAEGLIQAVPRLLEAAGKIVVSIVEGIISYGHMMSETGQEIVGKIGEGIKSVLSKASEWGKDLISGLIDGIKSKISAVKDAVGDVASTIKSYLHFSVPDVGPLTDYQTWMPDFMKGLASGIEKNKKIVADAVHGLANEFVLNPTANLAAVPAGAGGTYSQVININVQAAINDNMDIHNLAIRLGQEMDSIRKANMSMRGEWSS